MTPTTGVRPSLDIAGRTYQISRPVTVIGRGTDTDVMLDDSGVSRRHAEIHITDGRARIIDLGSTNGTFVDGAKRPVSTLVDGSVITIGRTRMVFHPGDLASVAPPGSPDAHGPW
jgi:pSer/pThr/pTyr-binding forkhead associated (FHA) protein